ncbi:ketopantoate reductase family protein [Frondihabitans sp. VKM Ac-2883]|uniref:ketopantoate reductase family protein n=1 Tax=Frondihabitans sp. VKM Ac-2883 TaxID=2783823 RepID=UPI00188BB24B|nr:ketopantoate reductase family protein [Frondihabitans sp. VKM Ac-2883]MBF4577183.1 ketopantoate reductase family protein [Frondihabitans sp. VKM Ac-2883]
MRYVIIGAGAIGGVLGARLAQHGSPHEPLLIARGDHGALIAADGLRIRSPESDVVVRVPVAASPGEVRLEADDVLVVATKTQSLDEALRDWVDRPVYSGDAVAGTAGSSLPLLVALNGLEGERIASRYFDRVFGVCVWLPGVHLVPGEVLVRIAPSSGTFIIGRFGAVASNADLDLLATLEADWEAAGFRVFIDDDVMRWKHRKLLSNLGNAVQAILGPSDPSAGAIHGALEAEAVELYHSLGISWPSDAAEAERRGNAFDIRPVPGAPDELGGSSWQSVQRGGSIETDYLNGEIALLARLHGRTAPLNAEVQRLARVGPGAADELRRLFAEVG